jgi:hypothetical protein
MLHRIAECSDTTGANQGDRTAETGAFVGRVF